MFSKSILFIGTFSPPVTGQSFAFEASYLNYKGPKFKINKTPSGSGAFAKAISHFSVTLKVIYMLVFKKTDKVYMTCFSTIEGSLSDVMVLFLCYCFRKRVIVHLQGSNFRAVVLNAVKPYRWILTQLYRRVDKAIVLLENMRDQFDFLLSPEKIEVVTNFYDPVLESVPVNYRETRRISGNLKVGYLSNLIYSKGILYVVEAMEALLAEGAAITLHVAGKYMSDHHMSEDEMRQRFEAKLQKFPQIKYYGVVSGKEKLNFYKDIDVFVLPTFYLHEAQPLSIIEAMRAGCVVISTNYKYIPNLVSSANGYLVEARSVEAVAKSLRHILENPVSCGDTQRNNIKTAIEAYSQETYLQKLYSIFAGD